jgi:hypothetical protein
LDSLVSSVDDASGVSLASTFRSNTDLVISVFCGGTKAEQVVRSQECLRHHRS